MFQRARHELEQGGQKNNTEFCKKWERNVKIYPMEKHPEDVRRMKVTEYYIYYGFT